MFRYFFILLLSKLFFENLAITLLLLIKSFQLFTSLKLYFFAISINFISPIEHLLLEEPLSIIACIHSLGVLLVISLLSIYKNTSCLNNHSQQQLYNHMHLKNN